jgi:hypothetical protein
MEAVGNSQWFEQMLAELGHELWIGDAAQIRRLVVRQQKTDRRDAKHILDLLLDGRFPRLWVPSAAMRDVRQLLRHRQKLVEIRTQVKNQLQHLALNQGVRRKRGLWSKCKAARCWSSCRCKDGRRGVAAICWRCWTGWRNKWENWIVRCARKPEAAGSAAVDDPSGRGAGGGIGVCVDHRAAHAISTRQARGQLSGTDPAGTFFRGPSEVGIDQQARQHHDAHVAGRSGADGCAVR